MKAGDYIFYYCKKDGTVPAVVLAVTGRRLKIKGNFNEGDRTTFVAPSNCVLQSELQ